MTMRKPTQLEIARFWRHVNYDGPVVRPELGPCWLWEGSQLRGDRHGQFHYDRRTVYAHRFAWALAHGDPGDNSVRHRCDVMNCVRVAHHRLGTQAENMADMRRRGRANDGGAKGEKHGNARLTAAIVLACRERYAAGETATALALEFGVRNTTMSMAVTGKTWRHLHRI